MMFNNIYSITNSLTRKCVASKNYCTSQYGKYVLFHLPLLFYLLKYSFEVLNINVSTPKYRWISYYMHKLINFRMVKGCKPLAKYSMTNIG
jgi:hypothetical protein